ncbi:MAG TPA: hypothetical protein PLU83_09990 [Phycicoccus sp.]|nr:hypothetical protein [Phycicoccus sp.]HRA45680.1 hypothetical protein [Phycicoccus sp.]
MIRSNALRGWVLLGSLGLLGGCGSSAGTTVAGPSAPVSTSVSPSASQLAPRCSIASTPAVAAIDAAVRAKGEGNSVPAAISWADPAAKAWWLVGAFDGPAGSGEGALGIWSTAEDPTSDSFAGQIFAVDGAASSWSSAPGNSLVKYDPTDVPALGCWSQKGR